MQKEINVDGLDFFDTLYHIEDSFLIAINDEDINPNMRIKELISLILSRLKIYKKVNYYLTPIVCNQIKNYLVENQGINAEIIKPETKLESLFPIECRQQDWKNFQNSFSFPISNLYNSGWCCLNYISRVLYGSKKTKINFPYENFECMVKDIVAKNYFRIQKNSLSYNENEVTEIILYFIYQLTLVKLTTKDLDTIIEID